MSVAGATLEPAVTVAEPPALSEPTGDRETEAGIPNSVAVQQLSEARASDADGDPIATLAQAYGIPEGSDADRALGNGATALEQGAAARPEPGPGEDDGSESVAPDRLATVPELAQQSSQTETETEVEPDDAQSSREEERSGPGVPIDVPPQAPPNPPSGTPPPSPPTTPPQPPPDTPSQSAPGPPPQAPPAPPPQAQAGAPPEAPPGSDPRSSAASPTGPPAAARAAGTGTNGQPVVAGERIRRPATTPDVTEQPPAEMLKERGDNALQTLDQVATTTRAQPAAGAAMPPGDAGATAAGNSKAGRSPSSDSGAPAPRDDARPAAQVSDTALQAARQGVGRLASTPVEFATGTASESSADGTAASAMMESFLGAVATRTEEILGVAEAVPSRLHVAADAAVGAIEASVEQQSEDIATHVAQLAAMVDGEAGGARALVASRFTATTEGVTTATANARSDLATEFIGGLKAIETAETAQLSAIEEKYRTADADFRGAGRKVGEAAETIGAALAKEYMKDLADVDDNDWDGPLKYNQGEARATTAREMSAAYKSGLIDEANKQADLAKKGKSRDVDAVHTTARQARTALTAQRTAVLRTLADAEAASLRQAREARSRLDASIATALTGAKQALATQHGALIDNLRATARTQTAAVQRSAEKQVGALQEQAGRAAAGLVELGSSLAAQVKGQPLPPPQQLAAAMAQASGQLDAAALDVATRMDLGQATSEEQIATAAAAVCSELATSGKAGMQGATSTASQISTTLAQLGIADALRTIAVSHESTTATTAATTVGGIAAAVDGVQKAYAETAKGMEAGFKESAKGLEQGLRDALPKMKKAIGEQADENAAHVPPRWKNVARWVAIVVVVLVVAFVAGPFVIGAVGAALGTGAVVTGIVAGAIIGGVTSATIQVINNVAESRPLREGVIKAAIVGAIGGAVGGGFGVWVGQLGNQGVALAGTAFRQFALNTVGNIVTENTINLVTGDLTWKSFGMSIVSAVAVGGAMHGIGGLKPVSGLQQRSMALGERAGGFVRTSLGSTVTINYRPTVAGPGKLDDTGSDPGAPDTPTAKPGDPGAPDVPTTKPDEPTPPSASGAQPDEPTPPSSAAPPDESAPPARTARPDEPPPPSQAAQADEPAPHATSPSDAPAASTDAPTTGADPTLASTSSAADDPALPGRSTDAAPPRRLRVLRQDNDFLQAIDPKTGGAKSHLAPSGDFIPANPNGTTTPVQHVQGNRNPKAKADSPHTSAFTEGGKAKVYGAQQVEIDVARLQVDIEAGRVQGVKVITPPELQGMIKEQILEINAATNVEAGIAQGVEGIDAYVRSLGMSKSKSGDLSSLLRAYFNTTRDGEWLITGIIPRERVSTPIPTPGYPPPAP